MTWQGDQFVACTHGLQQQLASLGLTSASTVAGATAMFAALFRGPCLPVVYGSRGWASVAAEMIAFAR